MAGHGGAYGHGRSVFVANLSYQDNIRVLAQYRADAIGETEPGRGIGRSLPDHGSGVFDRVFQGHDIDGFAVQVLENRVQGGGLAAAGRAGNQDQAFRTLNHALQRSQVSVSQAQLVQGNDAFLPVQHPQDYILPVQRRQRGYAEIHLPSRHGQGNTAVLRQTGFGYVQPRHHLHPHGKRRPVVLMQAAHLPQHAVDAVTKAQEALFRFKVDIRGAAFHRVGQQGIDQPDYRLAVFIALRRQAPVVELARFYFIQDTVDGQFITVEAINGIFDVGLRGKHRRDFRHAAQVGADAVQGNNIEGIRQRHLKCSARRVIADGHDPQTPGHFLGDHGDGFTVGYDGLQIYTLLSERAADDVVDDGLGHEPQAHQDPGGLFPAVVLLHQRNFKLVGGDDPLVDEYFAQGLPGKGIGLGSVRARHGHCCLSARMRLMTGRMSRLEPPCSTSLRVAR